MLLNWIRALASRSTKRNIAPAPAGQCYRLIVICQPSGADRAVDLLSFELGLVGLGPQRIQREEDDAKRVVKIVATVVCEPLQRAALVRFVKQAGFLRGVRSVRWESVPQPDVPLLPGNVIPNRYLGHAAR
jgi:hypothetical protein